MWHFVTVVDVSTIVVLAILVIIAVALAVSFGIETVRSLVARRKRPRG